jgi:hypothetical protein
MIVSVLLNRKRVIQLCHNNMQNPAKSIRDAENIVKIFKC